MKVAILTFQNALNYGAILQAYALQQAINKLGGDCEIIDYQCSYINEHYKTIRFDNCKNIKKILVSASKIPFRQIRKNRFKNFSNTYVKLTASVDNDKIIDLNNNFDKFVVGSDQVWNYKLTGNDSHFFLDFVDDKKKYSYAACFGFDEIPDNLKQDYFSCLKHFSEFSVRDVTSENILMNLFNGQKKVSVNVDPTLLLTKQDWENLSLDKSSDDYILIYSLNPRVLMDDLAKEMMIKENCKVYYICNDIYEYAKIPKEYKKIFSPNPKEFLSLFYNAKYVLTNSFHGTVFSILFHKRFFSEVNYGTHINHRINDLLNSLNLANRIIHKNLDYSTNVIDYEKVDFNLKSMREKSLEYLKKSVLK